MILNEVVLPLVASMYVLGLQRPPLSGWSAIATRVALTYSASIIVALAAQHAGCPDLIRSPSVFLLIRGR